MLNSRPKTKYVRSKKLMSAYRMIECQICGRDDGTVVGAHSNWAAEGKGRSIKASDDKCASLCARCHSSLDQGMAMDNDEKRALWLDAHHKTVDKLKTLGLWNV